MNKIVVIGAGNVGASSAAAMAQDTLGNIFLYDTMEGLAAGRAMDINQASPFLHTDCRVTGSDRVEVLADADVVVITAGIARQAGMTRLDLLRQNIEVAEGLSRLIMSHCPQARVLVVTNPVDVLSWYLKHTQPRMNVFGLGCSLDTLRFRYFIADAAGVSVDSVQGMVIGTHNDDMIPLVNHAVVNGIPLADLVSGKTMDAIRESTRKAGTLIVQMLKHHSGFYAASRVVSQVVESLVFDRREVFPLSVMCTGEYGYEGISLALPCIVGCRGIESVLEVNLNVGERRELETCASAMAEVTAGLA